MYILMSLVHILPAKLQCTHTQPLSRRSSMCINPCKTKECHVCACVSPSLSDSVRILSPFSLACTCALSVVYVLCVCTEQRNSRDLVKRIWHTWSKKLASATVACDVPSKRLPMAMSVTVCASFSFQAFWEKSGNDRAFFGLGAFKNRA